MSKIYFVPTPIGNLKDITLRALETLKEVDIIACEDTRHSLRLLNHYEIKKQLISYHQHNEGIKSDYILELLNEGKNIAVISDAGSPGISDPGSVILKKCIENNMEYEVLPGATAIITALVSSGMDSTSFIFKGFLPKDKGGRDGVLNEVKDRQETIIIYEAPHRLRTTLAAINEIFGNRTIAICRELTKMHEEIIRLSLEKAIEYYQNNDPRGEYVLVVEGKSEEELKEEKSREWFDMDIEQHIKFYIDKGDTKKISIKKVAEDRNMQKSEVYKHSYNI